MLQKLLFSVLLAGLQVPFIAFSSDNPADPAAQSAPLPQRLQLLTQAEHQRDSGNTGDNKQTVYTCPMHPQIQQNAPGQCPICGMTLVIKDHDSSSAHAQHKRLS